jgi:hypothetical protein
MQHWICDNYVTFVSSNGNKTTLLNDIVLTQTERKGFKSQQGQLWDFFLFATASRPTLGLTQPIQWAPGALTSGVKRPGRQANHLPPSIAKVNNAWNYIPFAKYVFRA